MYKIHSVKCCLYDTFILAYYVLWIALFVSCTRKTDTPTTKRNTRMYALYSQVRLLKENNNKKKTKDTKNVSFWDIVKVGYV